MPGRKPAQFVGLKRLAVITRYTCVGYRLDAARIVKIVAFFVAGMVVAVGGALIYSMSHGMAGPLEMTRTRAATPRGETAAQLTLDLDHSGASSETPPRGGEAVTPVPEGLPHRMQAKYRRKTAARVRPFREAYQSAKGDAIQSHPSGAPMALAATSSSGPPAPSSAAATFQVAQLTPAAPQTLSRQIVSEQRAVGSQPARQLPRVITLEPGFALTMRLSQELSAESVYRGFPFRGALDEPLVANGFILAQQGSPVFGRVESAHRARLLGGEAKLILTLTGITTSDGQTIAVQTSPLDEKGSRTTIGNTAKIAMDTAVGAVIGALSGAAKGAGLISSSDDIAATERFKITNHRNLVLPAGTSLTFRLAMPFSITERLNTH